MGWDEIKSISFGSQRDQQTPKNICTITRVNWRYDNGASRKYICLCASKGVLRSSIDARWYELRYFIPSSILPYFVVSYAAVQLLEKRLAVSIEQRYMRRWRWVNNRDKDRVMQVFVRIISRYQITIILHIHSKSTCGIKVYDVHDLHTYTSSYSSQRWWWSTK